MLAGVGGIDLLLFVISAEDSIKPQTREHFDICRLLQVPRGITVLTKSDLVDAETLEVVRLEVEDFLRGSFLDAGRSPIIPVSALTGAGLDRLKQELARVAGEVAQKDAHAAFRLPIDRVFTMKGFGTVVTGTMIGGEVHKEQEVELLPAQRSLRVRGVQVHNQQTERAQAGERTALNLANVAPEELARGMMLATPGLLMPARRLDVRLSLLNSARELQNRARVHLHLFTAETIAEVALYEGQKLAPGGEAWAQLRSDEPVACVPGDRFILRQFSPVATIGGGVVVDVAPVLKLKPEARIAMLERLASGDDLIVLRELARRRGEHGLRRDEAIHETGWVRERLERAEKALVKAGEIAAVGGAMIDSAVFERVKADLLHSVEVFHAANPLVGGIARQELAERSGLSGEVFSGALEALLAARKLAATGEQLHLPGRGVQMKDEEAESKAQIERAFAAAGLKVPALKEVLAGLKIDRARAEKIVTLLLREKLLVKISDELVFHAGALAALKAQVAAMKAQSPKMDVGRFKDAFGLTRKYAVPLLEYLDRERVTRRVGDERVIL